MRIYGLIGYPLGHSFSERYFAQKFDREMIIDCAYRNFPIKDIALLVNLLQSTTGLCGLNVTIPYKQAVMPFLDAIDPVAARIGAVNCIRIEDGRLTGYNTDEYGFRASLLELIGDKPKAERQEKLRALVLGSGGASKAVAYVLRGLGIDFNIVSRSAGDNVKGTGTWKNGEPLAYDELTPEVMDACKLIINTTPLGTFPDTNHSPYIPYDLLTPQHMLYDLVYNPPQTRFLALGAQKGARTMNGEKMLIGQAERSWEIWTTNRNE